MFESLSQRLNTTFRNLAGLGRISAENVEPALKEIRLALLEADVHFKVVRSFLEAVKVRALGAEVIESVTPADQFVKIVHDELARTLGAGEPVPELREPVRGPMKVLLCGLQGAGKTTCAAKLARLWTSTALSALDLRRPAAVEQLRVLAQRIDAPFLPPADLSSPSKSATAALAACPASARRIIFDTAGRLQLDTELMDELKAVHAVLQPDETLLVLDAMVGQEAVKVAEAFHAAVPLTGVVLAKTDGDARGGAALSVRFLTGVPIRWVGTGEGPQAIETFDPVRFAGRILGMGDVVSLVERAAREMDQGKAEAVAKRMMAGELDMEMFLDQIREMKKMGPISELLQMLPGAANLATDALPADRDIARFEAMILSMTPEERRNPEVINHPRRGRIAKGAGVNDNDVHRMLKQFRQARDMMSALSGGGRKGKAMRRMFGMK